MKTRVLITSGLSWGLVNSLMAVRMLSQTLDEPGSNSDRAKSRTSSRSAWAVCRQRGEDGGLRVPVVKLHGGDTVRARQTLNRLLERVEDSLASDPAVDEASLGDAPSKVENEDDLELEVLRGVDDKVGLGVVDLFPLDRAGTSLKDSRCCLYRFRGQDYRPSAQIRQREQHLDLAWRVGKHLDVLEPELRDGRWSRRWSGRGGRGRGRGRSRNERRRRSRRGG